MEVLAVFLELGGRKRRTIREVAMTAGVSTGCAQKVVTEFLSTGTVEDPSEGVKDLAKPKTNYTKIGP
jgi:hypothetical protein